MDNYARKMRLLMKISVVIINSPPPTATTHPTVLLAPYRLDDTFSFPSFKFHEKVMFLFKNKKKRASLTLH
jgi:hypothetical protein